MGKLYTITTYNARGDSMEKYDNCKIISYDSSHLTFTDSKGTEHQLFNIPTHVVRKN